MSASTSTTIARCADVARVTVHGSCFALGDDDSSLLSARTRSVTAAEAWALGRGGRADHSMSAANRPNAASHATPASNKAHGR